MHDDQIGRDGLKGRPDGSIDEFNQDNVPKDGRELEDRAPLERLFLLHHLSLCLCQTGLASQVTHDEGIDQVHEDRKAAEDKGKPEGPDPIARGRRDRVGDQGAQERRQTTDRELQTDGQRQVSGTKPFGQQRFLHGHNQTTANTKHDTGNDHQRIGFIFGSKRG